MEKLLVEPVTGGPRTLVLLTNRPAPDPDLPLDRLPGEGGRFDLVARFVNACLLTSHGIREDAHAIIAFADDEVALRVRGDAVTGIGPDERSTAARLLGALDAVPMPVWQEVADGIDVASLELDELLDQAGDPVVRLAEDGEPLTDLDVQGGTFVFGGHEGFTDDRAALLDEASEATATLGTVPLQADHAAAVLHNQLDRA